MHSLLRKSLPLPHTLHEAIIKIAPEGRREPLPRWQIDRFRVEAVLAGVSQGTRKKRQGISRLQVLIGRDVVAVIKGNAGLIKNLARINSAVDKMDGDAGVIGIA